MLQPIAQLRSLGPLAAIAGSLLTAAPAMANCADTVASLDFVEPAMARLWPQLQAQTTYPWGTARPYDRVEGQRIVLTPEFDDLNGAQKQQVIRFLLTGGEAGGLYNLLTPEERARPGIGAVPPYRIVTHNGKLLFVAYDGCTPMTMLTERDRYSYYYNRLPYDLETQTTAAAADLRNAGRPFWRDAQFPIAAADELALRQSFWHAIGYDNADRGWWIAWVPEDGYFEINVPERYDAATLQRFWRVAPSQYRYTVLDRKSVV